MFWRFALRDLRGARAGLRLMALCLLLGVLALAGIGSLSSAILSGLSERGQLLLGGDVQFEVAQRVAAPEERQAFDQLGRVSEVIRMRAMASLPDMSRSVLVELKGVDTAYPLYGQFSLAPGALKPRPQGLEAVIAPGLADKLGLQPGSVVRVGAVAFTVVGIIAEEPDRAGAGFTYGPTFLVDSAGLAATGLVQPGSLFRQAIVSSCRLIAHQRQQLKQSPAAFPVRDGKCATGATARRARAVLSSGSASF